MASSNVPKEEMTIHIYKLECSGCGRTMEKFARRYDAKCYDCLIERKRKTAREYARAKQIQIEPQS